jgi:protein involved in temperature-dependent protein secretion
MEPPPDDSHSTTLLKQLHESPPSDQAKIIQLLTDQAVTTGAADDLSNLAIGLSEVGQLDDAIQIFEDLIKAAPDRDTARANLASVYCASSQFELARYQFNYLAQRGATEQMRAWSREQVDLLVPDQESTPAAKGLRERQIAALRERIAFNEGVAAEYTRLGRLLLDMGPETTEQRAPEEVTSLLEEGHSRYPHDVGILELLAHCYLRFDVATRLSDVLQQLEKEAPDSALLRRMQEIDADKASAHGKTMMQRMHRLVHQVHTDDVELQSAVLHEMRSIAQAFPQNPNYRWFYAFGLGLAGQKDKALIQAEILAQTAGTYHILHFNVAQIFWNCGDRARAEHHLDLAFQYAANQQERDDVRLLRAEILKD